MNVQVSDTTSDAIKTKAGNKKFFINKNFNMDPQQKDELLWQMAKRRAAFKWSLATYIFVNLFLIAIWYFTSGPGSYFWPIWPMLGWGIGMAFQYFGAYHGNSIFTVEEEYEKLKRNQQ